jgi:hypothetical protein
MSTRTNAVLPAGFEPLQRFSDWILPTERQRIEARLTTPYETSREFYDAVLAEIPRIMPYLLTRPVQSVATEDQNLLDLTLAFVEISNAVEIYEESEIPDGANLRLFVSVLDGAGV